MKKTVCSICGREISNCNIEKHLKSHVKNPSYQEALLTRQSTTHGGLNCKYCQKLCKNRNSLAQHECRCYANPNRYTVVTYSNTKPRIAWNKGLTKYTDSRVAQYGNTLKSRMQSGEVIPSQLGKPISTETKQKISSTCLARSKEGTWHKSLAKNLHYKYNGVDLDGSWEYQYAMWLDKNKIAWERPTIRFKYQFENAEHYYTPDFYLPATAEYVEVKGFKTAKDVAKWQQFPKGQKLVLLFEQDLKNLGII